MPAVKAKKEGVATSTTTAVDIYLEKVSMLGKTFGSQQEKSDLIESLKNLIYRFSTDKLEEVLPPANASIQKGRSSTTKRHKTGEKHEDEKIEEEIKEEKKKKRGS